MMNLNALAFNQVKGTRNICDASLNYDQQDRKAWGALDTVHDDRYYDLNKRY